LKIQDLRIPKGSKKQGYLRISEKPAGPFQIPMTVINGSGDGPTLVINGGVHGSEYNGPAAALRLQVELNATNIDGNVIIVPLVNTLAFEGRWMHSNPIDYRDLTDCFVPEVPKRGSGHPVVSYQLAQVFYKEILSKADYRLDLHGGDLEEDVLESTWYRRTGEDPRRDDIGLALCRNFGWLWIRESVKKPEPAKSSDEMPMPISMGTEALGMGRCQHDIVDRVVRGCVNVMK